MTRTRADVPDVPRTSELERTLAMTLAAGSYERFTALLRTLEPADWARPTECPGWDVRAMAGHVLGMTEMAASIRESVRQTKAARRRGGVLIDALTAIQVEEHRHLSTAELLDRLDRTAPKAVRARRRTPGLIRRRPMPDKQLAGDREEVWTYGYLIDTILTRDPWMHRVDISRAVSREPALTADHDGRIVADVVADWARRHGAPCRLTLTGPAGGTWAFGTGGPTLELDAVEFCRILSGRGEGTGLLATAVPF